MCVYTENVQSAPELKAKLAKKKKKAHEKKTFCG